jgi:hypothetical protein
VHAVNTDGIKDQGIGVLDAASNMIERHCLQAVKCTSAWLVMNNLSVCDEYGPGMVRLAAGSTWLGCTVPLVCSYPISVDACLVCLAEPGVVLLWAAVASIVGHFTVLA